MSDHTHRSSGRGARWRAVAAVLSLYGLVLQAFLTGLAPAPAATATGILCLGHQEPAGSDVPVHAHACCPLACAGFLAPPAPAAGQAWPSRVALGLTWRVAAPASSHGSVAGAASARGPPAA